MAGCTLFRISVRGTGCHGAMPETGVDPIGIAAHIWLALQELTGRELLRQDACRGDGGSVSGGTGPQHHPGGGGAGGHHPHL